VNLDSLEAWLQRVLAHRYARVVAGALAVIVLGVVAGTSAARSPGISWAELVEVGPREDGWTVSPAERGSEHDVVFIVRRASVHVEVHVVPRGMWEGVQETPSFGVGYETPRTTATPEEAAGVTAWFAAGIARRDTGLLGPVDAIPLVSAGPPLVAAMAAMRGPAGLALGASLLALLLVLARDPRVLAFATFVLGLALRGIELGLPFAHDQDVQRIVSGALPLGEILFGHGLDDRHPPLWFLVLHLAEIGGQAEWIARLPAVLAGALLGPAIVWAAQEARPGERASPITVACAAIAAISPTLVGAAREVSEIPFFSLAIVALVALSMRTRRSPARGNQIALGLAHALVLWTYYTGVFVIVAAWGVHLAMQPEKGEPERALRRASLVGTAVGLPAIGLAVRMAVLDSGARAAAQAHPDIAWGDATPLSMLVASGLSTVSAVGLPVFVLALALAVAVRAEPARVAVGIGVGVAALTAAIAPIVRVQPYYVLAVAPMFLLAPTLAALPTTWRPALTSACVVLASVWFVGTSGPPLAVLYAPEADAVMARYLARCRRDHVTRVVTVAAYDSTLVAYYAARAASRPLTRADLEPNDGWLAAPGLSPSIGFLAQSHGADTRPGAHAAERLRAWLAEGPLAVIRREEFVLPEVDAVLDHCELLDHGARTRLSLCQAEPRR
jgi:hypothetical protein